MSQQSWTNIGSSWTTDPHHHRAIEGAIAELDWIEVTGRTVSLPLMPGEAIKRAIHELRLPNVSRVAYGVVTLRPGSQEDGFGDVSLLGIEANYSNGRARVYLLDHGSDLTPIMSELFEREEAGRAA